MHIVVSRAHIHNKQVGPSYFACRSPRPSLSFGHSQWTNAILFVSVFCVVVALAASVCDSDGFCFRFFVLCKTYWVGYVSDILRYFRCRYSWRQRFFECAVPVSQYFFGPSYRIIWNTCSRSWRGTALILRQVGNSLIIIYSLFHILLTLHIYGTT